MSDVIEQAAKLEVSPKTRLVGDVGGSTLRLVEIDLEGNRLAEERIEFPGRQYESLTEGIATFLAKIGRKPAVAVIGVAGPLDGQVAGFTNISQWTSFDADVEGAHLGVDLRLYNDLVVAAAALPTLGDEDVAVLRPGTAATNGTKMVTTLLTGVNDALAVANQDGTHAYLACESGHAPMSARDQREVQLLQWAWAHGPDFLSFENCLSGGEGWSRLFEFVTDDLEIDPLAQTRESLVSTVYPAKAIGEAALVHGDPACIEVLNMAGAIAGTYIGGRALATRATGGVYLIGGIGSSETVMTYYAQQTPFLDRIANQGNQSHVVKDIPVFRVKIENPGLVGAIELARHA